MTPSRRRISSGLVCLAALLVGVSNGFSLRQCGRTGNHCGIGHLQPVRGICIHNDRSHEKIQRCDTRILAKTEAASCETIQPPKVVQRRRNRQRNKWDDMYALLNEYREREGHCNIPRKHKENGLNLGMWVCSQRQSKKKGTLDPYRTERLEQIGIVWSHRSTRSWDEMCVLLEQYKEREGHCNPLSNHQEDGQNLGLWLCNQRRPDRKLEPRKEQRLKDLGVVWDPRDAFWDESFELLHRFRQREGHCDVPQKHKEEGHNLGLWLSNQRQSKKNGKLDSERERRLEELGVLWSHRSKSRWEDMFALLKQYKEREGHCNLPVTHKEDRQNLGRWLCSQRQKKNSGKVDSVKINQLEELGVVWSRTNNDKWEDMYALLNRFQQREGHCNVPRGYREEDRNLGLWVNNQRQSQINGKLDPIKEKRLDDLGVVWSRRAKKSGP